jgi:hypothetical protein
MGTITAQTIINQAAVQLLDPSNVRWTRAELLDWINAGQKQIVILSPNATNKTWVYKLAVGTRQAIPSDGWTLLDVIRNMGTNGTTPGRTIRVVSEELMDNFDPYWHAALPVATVRNVIFNQQDQTFFYVYPPNNGNGYIQINYAPVPPTLLLETETISLNDIFMPVLLDYVLYRACSKDAEYAPGVQLAAGYLQTFMASMQTKSAAELANSPNNKLGPLTVTTPGSQS